MDNRVNQFNSLSFRLCIEGYKEIPEKTNSIKNVNPKNLLKTNLQNLQNLTFVPNLEENTTVEDSKLSNIEGEKKDEVKEDIYNNFNVRFYNYITNFISYMILVVTYLKYLLNSLVTKFYYFKYVF